MKVPIPSSWTIAVIGFFGRRTWMTVGRVPIIILITVAKCVVKDALGPANGSTVPIAQFVARVILTGVMSGVAQMQERGDGCTADSSATNFEKGKGPTRSKCADIPIDLRVSPNVKDRESRKIGSELPYVENPNS
jgi:hypothetical protein